MNPTLKYVALLLFSLTCASVWAQQREISGRVLDMDGEPLPGSAILIKNTTEGTVTDSNGEFKFSIPNDGKIVLVVSFIGFLNEEITVGNQTQFEVTLVEDIETLQEIVVVGYGTQKKRDLTGAVASLDAQALEDRPIASLEQALEGRLSGVTVSQNSGQPGGGISVRIRGITSLTGTNEPLYVVDGVPLEADKNNETIDFSTIGAGGRGQTKVSALSTLNPADIESIEVLKDASASAIYGSRAANGVVLITTKKGKKGQSKIAFDSYYGVQEATTRIDVLDLKEYVQYQNEVRTDIGWGIPVEYSRPERLGEGTDWQDEIFQSASIQSHQLSVSGGSETTSFYTSFNYFKQEGIVLNTGFDRFSFRVNVEHKVNNWFKIGNTISISGSDEQIALTDAATGIIAGAVQAAPDVAVRFSDGSWGGPRIVEGVGGSNNPVAWAEIRNSNLNRKKILGNLYTEVSFLKDLKLRTELGYDYNVNNSSVFNPTHDIGDGNEVSESTRRSINSLYWQLKNYLTYNKEFGEHKITAMIGHEIQDNEYRYIWGNRKGFLTNDIQELDAGDATLATNGGGVADWNMMSYFSRVNYSFKDRYLLTATIRADGSSNFDKGNKWGTFPSFSVGWVASEEDFFPSQSAFNWLKIRAGYGETGNQNVPAYAFGAILRNIPSQYGPAFMQDNIANPNLSWETMVSYNIGLETGFFNNRIRLDADIYQKTSEDFLFQVPSLDIYGAINNFDWLGLNSPIINAGEIRNRGIDLTLKTVNVETGNFTWGSNIVFSHYQNKVVSLPEGLDRLNETFDFGGSIITQTEAGQPIGRFYGYQVDRLFQTQEEVDNSPFQTDGTAAGDIKWVDQNDDGIIDANDRVFIGNPHPDFTFGIGNNFGYKNFDLSVFVNGSYGNEIYNYNRRNTEGMTQVTTNQSTAVLDRFTSENTETNVPRFVQGDPNGNATQVSDRFIEDGSYLRIQNITLGYTLPTALLKKTGIERLRVYGTVQNLHTFTDYTGYDPAIGSYNQRAGLSGFDAGRYPVSRVIQLGVNVEF